MQTIRSLVVLSILSSLVAGCGDSGDYYPHGYEMQGATPPNERLVNDEEEDKVTDAATFLRVMYQIPTLLAEQGLDFKPEEIRFEVHCWDFQSNVEFVLRSYNPWDSTKSVQWAGTDSDFSGALTEVSFCSTEVMVLANNPLRISTLYGGVTEVSVFDTEYEEMTTSSNICRSYPEDKVDETNFYLQWENRTEISPICFE